MFFWAGCMCLMSSQPKPVYLVLLFPPSTNSNPTHSPSISEACSLQKSKKRPDPLPGSSELTSHPTPSLWLSLHQCRENGSQAGKKSSKLQGMVTMLSCHCYLSGHSCARLLDNQMPFFGAGAMETQSVYLWQVIKGPQNICGHVAIISILRSPSLTCTCVYALMCS